MSNDVVVLYEQNPSFDLIETGPGPGPPGATGLPGLVWQGAWSSATAYIAGDAVSLAGSSYICILGHTNHTPPNATYWNVLAAVGTNGTNGVPGLVWRGAWSGATAYAVGDAVSLAGSSYICISAHTNHTPPNATYWNVLASVGATGATGMTWQGAWSGATAYVIGDGVSLAGSSYICILGHTNHTPPNATYWNVLASVGATGATGATGMTWQGAWNSGTAYVVGDGVDLGGASYICILGHTNHTPPNATYWNVLADRGVDGTGATSTGTEASRPAAGTAGNLYLPSDGYYLERDTGAAWSPWGPLFPMFAPPNAASWTWVNQGTATATDSAGSLVLRAPGSGAINLRALVKSLPATPYTVRACLRYVVTNLNYQMVALGVRESGSGKLVLLWHFGSGNVVIEEWSSPTAGAAGSLSGGGTLFIGGLIWFQISDNGTTRRYAISVDGQNFVEIGNHGHTAYLTPDQICLAAHNSRSSPDPDVLLTVHSYQEF